MKKTLPIIKVTFDYPITKQELSVFRKGLHNYLRLNCSNLPITLINDDYQYPLMQLRTNFHKDYLQPMLVVIGEAAQVLSKIWNQGDFLSIKLRSTSKKLRIAYLKLSFFKWRCSQELSKYRLFNYQVFNQRRYQDFQNIETNEGLHFLIKEALAGHIQTLYKAIGIKTIPQIDNLKILKNSVQAIGNTRFLCINLEFSCNVFLPEHIGLGNAVGRGFGTIRRPRKTLSRNLQTPSDIKGRPQNITQISS
jgi:hypothetical protein